MKGLIGYFDILGYKNFLENNPVTESDKTVDKVLDIIIDVPDETKRVCKIMEKTILEIQDFNKHFETLVFADTIIFTLEYPTDCGDEWIQNARTLMELFSGILTAKMFTYGLPVRGVIHEGDFIIKKNCFAGKAIVEAHQLCEALNLSGLVYSKSLGDKKLGAKNNEFNNDSWTTFTYLTPMKNGSEEKLLILNWAIYLGKNGGSEYLKDIEDFVLKSFWAHNKDCSSSVDIKVKNTVNVIRKMAHNIQLHTENSV